MLKKMDFVLVPIAAEVVEVNDPNKRPGVLKLVKIETDSAYKPIDIEDIEDIEENNPFEYLIDILKQMEKAYTGQNAYLAKAVTELLEEMNTAMGSTFQLIDRNFDSVASRLNHLENRITELERKKDED